MALIMDDYDRIVIPEGEVDHIADQDGTIWEKSTELTCEGSGSISFNANRNRALKSAVFYGSCRQKTYKGKNLLNPDTVPDVNKYISYTDGTAVTPAGTSAWRCSDYIPVQSGHQYCFAASCGGASQGGIAWYDAGKTFISGMMSADVAAGSGKITAPGSASYIRVSWEIAINADWHDTVWIYDYTTYGVSAYEPYVGGIPSPNADYPQTVQSNDAVWHLHGKNLINTDVNASIPDEVAFGNTTKRAFTPGSYIVGMTADNFYDPDRVSTASVSRGSVAVSAAGGYGIMFPLWLTGTKTITFTTDKGYSVGVSVYGEDGTWKRMIDWSMASYVGTKSFTFTLTAGEFGHLLFTCYRSGAVSPQMTTYTGIQIEEGSTATSYEPYAGGIAEMSGVRLNAIGNVRDEYDAETGIITRRIGSADLTTLRWAAGPQGSKYTYGVSGVIRRPTGRIVYPYGIMYTEDTLTRVHPDNIWHESTVSVTPAGELYIHVVGGRIPTGTVYFELAQETRVQATAQTLLQHKGLNRMDQIGGAIENTATKVVYYGKN